MAPKVEKPKKIGKVIEKSDSSIKKQKKKKFDSFAIYLYKVLKASPESDIGISRKSIVIMDNFVNDMLENIAREASSLVAHGKKRTLSSRDIQTAVKFLVPGELGRHANMEATKAIASYYRNDPRYE